MKEDARHKILIVDDDVEFRAAVVKILEKEGFAVDAASNGEAACAVLDKAKFDLIVTDLSMPKKDGMSLIDELNKKSPGASIIIITAFGDWGTYAEAMGKGICAFLNKPVKKEELLDAVNKCLKRSCPNKIA